MNPILWFLFAIVIPVGIAIILTIVILSVVGVNVASKIPVVSSFVQTDEEVSDEKDWERLEETIANQKKEITELKDDVNNLEQEIEQMELDDIKYKNEEASEANAEKEMVGGESQEKNTVKKISASFKKMKKKQAALIFQDLEKDIALSLMEELPNDVRGGILEAMDPKQAAELAELYIRSNE